jgi:SWIM zinc finger
VGARWTANDVLALAPDSASQRAAASLARPACWSDAGTAGDLVWGLCAGSGRLPYQTVVDLTGPAYRCSCPSRKFPCKHALALLLAWAGGGVPEQGEAAGYATAWQASRQARAASRAGPDGKPKDPAAAARRAEQRAQRVDGGVADLQVWLGDQIRAGLTAARAAGYGHAEAIAARMVDAQAPGLASVLRRLSPIPMSGDGWPGRLLAEYGLLHLLARAHEQAGTLPAALAAVVRSRVGYTTSREDVLATPPVTDRWQVLAVRDVLDGTIPARRVWLRGSQTGRFALLLSFAPVGNFGPSIEAALIPGLELDADLHFYPGQPELRAVIGTRSGSPAAAGRPAGPGDVTGLLSAWSAALEQDPWLTEWPVLLTGVPVPGEPGWRLVDDSGRALPLLGQESRWSLLAVSGGHPVCLAGEWNPAGLLALTVWHGDQAVRL